MPDSIGQIISRTRNQKGISLLQVYRALHIKEKYIAAIEADRFDDLPSPVQGKGFIRLYWDYLGLQASDLEVLLTPTPVEVNTPLIIEGKESGPSSIPEQNGDKGKILDEPVGLPQELAEIKSSTQILQDIGNALRVQRNRASLSVDSIESITHIPAHYIHALEAGKFDLLPSPVQARGMLSNYSEFLNLDTDALLLKYAEALQGKRNESLPLEEKNRRGSAIHLPKPGGMRKQGLAPARSIFSIDIMVVIALAVITFGSLIWGASSIVNYQVAPKATKTAQAMVNILRNTESVYTGMTLTSTLLPQSTETSTIQVVDEGPTATISAPTTSGFTIQVFVVALQRAYLQIITDGKVTFNGRVLPGNPYLFTGNKRIELITGNAGAIQVIFNQSDLGILGAQGEVIHLVFTINQYGTPTLTPSITPSATLVPSKTPKPSNTYPPTRTARPSNTPYPTRTPKPTRTPTP